ncbi:sulfurtransferase TusA family protein [Marinococcus sp. PL1-022]|uniref:sulfurtransferase TusA family protein n=1 Tax=Marinococcus sp. PL1-022 TaxID=3095363 RepID=UPI0029C4F2CD|nr:sulfurtransferase TusA family protein [Marinococcus sp. PL1-022]MDX6153129.1 sulfurtransferase TusA family protein [Marinococcus sp. PL1-022]
MEPKTTIDAKGLACPQPILKTKKAIKDMDSGEVLELHATDKGAQSDLTAWTKAGGHELLDHTEDNGIYKFWIQKG